MWLYVQKTYTYMYTSNHTNQICSGFGRTCQRHRCLCKCISREMHTKTWVEIEKQVCCCKTKTYKQDRGIQNKYNNLRLSMYVAKPGQLPCLKGKAAELRHLPGPLLTVCQTLLQDTCKEHKQTMLMLKCAIEMQAILDIHVSDYALPPAASDAFSKAAQVFCSAQYCVGPYIPQPAQ